MLRDGAGPIVALVKPQFEAGKADAKGGVVRDPAVHRRVLRETVARADGRRARDAATSSRRRSSGRRATASSSSDLQAGPGCADIETLIDAAVDAAWEGAG